MGARDLLAVGREKTRVQDYVKDALRCAEDGSATEDSSDCLWALGGLFLLISVVSKSSRMSMKLIIMRKGRLVFKCKSHENQGKGQE